MTADPIDVASTPASFVLGRKLDSIPFSAYHLVIIVVLGFVGFIEGYDLALTGSLLVLAKKPLHMDPDAVRALATWPTFLVVIGGFAAAAMSDRISRLSVMQIGVILSTLCTLLILFVKSFEQLLILRLITGFFLGFTISAPFPIAAELIPARLSARRPARRRDPVYHPGPRLLLDPGEPALAVASRPRPGRDRQCQSDDPALRQPGGDDGALRARRRRDRARRTIAAILAAVRARPAALDRDRGLVRFVRRHRLLSDRDPAAEGARQPGGGGGAQLWSQLAGVCRQHPRQAVQRLYHGSDRAALDDHARLFGIDPGSVADGAGASGGAGRHDRV